MNLNRARVIVTAMPEAVRTLSGPLERLVVETLEASMARIADPARAELPAGLQPACVAALERLWYSRSALARAVLRPPLLRAPRAAPGVRHGSRVDEEAIDLDIETERAALRFREATEPTETQPAPLVSPESDSPPPPWARVSPHVCASVLRWAIERSLDDPAARRPLLRIVADEIARRLPGLLLEAGKTASNARAPEPLPEPLAVGHMQPGQWFRLYMNGQWTMTRLSWRSGNGHFFMFHSNSGGRTHSLSLRSLERMVSEELIAAVALPASGLMQHYARPGHA